MIEAFDVTGLTIGTFNSIRELIEEFVYTKTDYESYLDDMKMYHRYCPDCGCFMR